MTPKSFLPGSDKQLGTVERRPGETLFDYLTRCRREMAGRIRILEMVRDAQETIFLDEDSRWRRHMILLALGEAVFAAGAYIMLDHIGVAGLLMGVLIGLAALAGAWMSIGILIRRETVAPHMVSPESKASRLARWIMPVEAAKREQKAASTDASTDAARFRWSDPELMALDSDAWLPIDPALEARLADYVEMEGFMWRLRLLFAETLVICGLMFIAELILGTGFIRAIDRVALIGFACLIGGFIVLFLSTFLSDRLVRISRWWRHR